jgi:hypothetical protein
VHDNVEPLLAGGISWQLQVLGIGLWSWCFRVVIVKWPNFHALPVSTVASDHVPLAERTAHQHQLSHKVAPTAEGGRGGMGCVRRGGEGRGGEREFRLITLSPTTVRCSSSQLRLVLLDITVPVKLP